MSGETEAQRGAFSGTLLPGVEYIPTTSRVDSGSTPQGTGNTPVISLSACPITEFRNASLLLVPPCCSEGRLSHTARRVSLVGHKPVEAGGPWWRVLGHSGAGNFKVPPTSRFHDSLRSQGFAYWFHVGASSGGSDSCPTSAIKTMRTQAGVNLPPGVSGVALGYQDHGRWETSQDRTAGAGEGGPPQRSLTLGSRQSSIG